MSSKRIAIACQGGGSQCAFVAGALKALFQRGVQHHYDIVGLSGTSGGALTAAVAWMGLLKEAQGDPTPVGDRVEAIWRDLCAQTPQEIALDAFCTQSLRLAQRGWLPTFASSPSSPQFRMWAQEVSRWIARPEFTDLRALLLKHIDFEELPSLVEPTSPTLLVGAGEVLEGGFKVFSSARDEIKLESVLASAAVPTLFPAVWVDGHAYWDGIFASNPPVAGFLRRVLMGKTKAPEEIWVVQVNPSRHEDVPESSSDIFDRRNHLAGNLNLQHELQLIQIVNMLVRENALTDEFRSRFGIEATEPVTVRFLRMTPELQMKLDYPSKLSRQPAQIALLMADGEVQANAFLAGLPDAETWKEGRVEGMRPVGTA